MLYQEEIVSNTLSGTNRVSDEYAEALSSASIRFQRPILRELSVGFAGTAEMEAVYSDGAADLDVSVSEERECQLQAARRIMVEEVTEISGSSPAERTYELVLQPLSSFSHGSYPRGQRRGH